MKRTSSLRLTSCIAICATCLMVVGVAKMVSAQPGSKGKKLKDCFSPYVYDETSFCNPDAAACVALHTCVTTEPYDCGAEFACPAGGCTLFKATTVISAGYCDKSELVTGHCTKCAFLACAGGTAYKNAMDCFMGANPQCAALLWSDSACEV